MRTTSSSATWFDHEIDIKGALGVRAQRVEPSWMQGFGKRCVGLGYWGFRSLGGRGVAYNKGSWINVQTCRVVFS